MSLIQPLDIENIAHLLQECAGDKKIHLPEKNHITNQIMRCTELSY